MFKSFKQTIYKLVNIGKPKFTCPICNYQGPFHGIKPPTGYRKHSKCPNCNSFERHRLQKLVLDKIFHNKYHDKLTILHFAPETFFADYFIKIASQYISADLCRKDVDINCDMKDLPFKDDTFDFVYASHVLEHIDDDIRAISEIERILKSNSIAVLPIPVVNDITIEYDEPNSFESGHVRAPGQDYFDRYKKIFSTVNLYYSSDFPQTYQTFLYEDRSQYPNKQSPHRKAYYKERYEDIVPVCIS